MGVPVDIVNIFQSFNTSKTHFLYTNFQNNMQQTTPLSHTLPSPGGLECTSGTGPAFRVPEDRRINPMDRSRSLGTKRNRGTFANWGPQCIKQRVMLKVTLKRMMPSQVDHECASPEGTMKGT